MSRAPYLLLLVLLIACRAPGPPEPADLRPLASEILALWDRADLVCLGETHGSLADAALRHALVAHPDFPATVDVVVVEFANPVHQDLLDRLVLGGEHLSREAIAPIWRDAGSGDFWELPLYEAFLRSLAAVNRGRPDSEKVRAVGGALAIDWSAVAEAEDLLPFVDRAAALRQRVRETVLDPGLQGLAIFGSAHCARWGEGIPAGLEREEAGRVLAVLGFAPERRAGAGGERGASARPRLWLPRSPDWADHPSGPILFEGFDPAGLRLGDFLDALVDYGRFGDRLVAPDPDALPATVREELARRAALRREAWDLYHAETAP